METRKIQQVSNGTFTVSLPREWATEHGLSAGDVVNICTHLDGALTIQPADDTARVELSISDETPAQLDRLLRAAYVVGAIRIEIVSEARITDEQRSALRSGVRALSGVTIGEESETEITVQSVLDSAQVSIRQSVRHLQFVALSRHRESTSALCDPTGAAGTVADEPLGDRLSSMVERYFVRSLSRLDEVDSLGERRPELFCFHRVAEELARIVSCADRIAAVARERDRPLADVDDEAAATIEAAAADVCDVTEIAVDSLFEADADAVWTVLETTTAVRESLDDLERQLFESSGGDYRIGHAIRSICRSADSAAAIATIGLRHSIRQGSIAETSAAILAADDAVESRVSTSTDN